MAGVEREIKKVIIFGHDQLSLNAFAKMLNMVPGICIEGELLHVSDHIRNKYEPAFDPEKDDAIDFLTNFFTNNHKEDIVGFCLSPNFIPTESTKKFYRAISQSFDNIYFIHINNSEIKYDSVKNYNFLKDVFSGHNYINLDYKNLKLNTKGFLNRVKKFLSLDSDINFNKKTIKMLNIKSILIISNENMQIDDCNFIFDFSTEVKHKFSTEKEFIMMKGKRLIDLYIDIFMNNDISNMFELGIRRGGSVAFYNRAFKPKNHAAIDIEKEPVDALNYITEQAEQDGRRLILSYGTDQSDKQALLDICKSAYDYGPQNQQPLDFVIDDASHLQLPTEASFEALFPLLRKDGLYAIEDWGWAHWDSFQGANAYFSEHTALTNTIFKLIILHTCRPDLISEIRITPVVAFFKRGPATLNPANFKIDPLLVLRDKVLPTI